MRTPVLCCLFALLVAPDSPGQGGRRGRRHSEPVELEHFEHSMVTIDSKALRDGEGEIGVYLPAGYDPEGEGTYPWILWLHGMNEDAGRFHYGGGAKALDAMRGADRIPDLILVAPSAPRRTIYANGERAGDVEDYILKDVIAYVEANYRVSKDPRQGDRTNKRPFAGPAGRASGVAGSSIGAPGVARQP